MAAKTTAAAGNWNSTSTWTGGVVPVNGDTVTINHAVSVTDARTVGHSPAAGSGTKAILCNAALTISGTGVLTCRGDIGLDTAGLTLQAGAVLEMDASAAASPSTARYIIGSTNFNAGSGILTISGSSGSRCTVRSNSGGANARIEYLESGQFVADFCDFIRIGDASNVAISAAPQGGQSFHIKDCSFDAACGPIGNKFGTAAASNATIELINVTHRGPVSVGLPAMNSFTGGARTISGCCFSGDVILFAATGYDITNTLFEAGWDMTGLPWASFEGNLIAMPEASPGDFATGGDITDCYILRVGDPTNQHGMTVSDVTGDYDGLIFDMPDGDDAAGDWITFNNTSSPKTINVKRCIVLPNAVGVGAGSLLSCLGGTNTTVVAEHNTFNAGLGVYVGETYAGHAGMLASCKSNIAWSEVLSVEVIHSEPGIVQDVVTSANADYNGKWNPDGDGYNNNLSFSSGTPGAHDISGNPNFVDRTRNIKTWDASLGGPGTVANALAKLFKLNEPDYNPAYSITNLMDYVRAGFVVQNSSMRVGAHDGTVMGAVQDAPPTSVTITSPTSATTYLTGSSSFSLSGTAADASGITSVAWTNDRGGSGSASGTTSWSISGITLQPGVNVITVTATSTLSSTGQDVITVTLDQTQPVVTITGPTSSPTLFTNSSTLTTLAGTATDNVGVVSVNWSNDRGGSGAATGTASWSVASITLQPGVNIITVTAMDAVGNTGTDSITVTLDTTAPVATITGPTSSATLTTATTPLSISGTASDAVGVASVTWANDRGGSGSATGTTSWSVSGITLLAGVNVITVTATDQAGNTGTDTLTVTYDPTAPAITITGPTSSATFATATQGLTLSGTASDNIAVTSVFWSNDRGGTGQATGTTSWSVTGIIMKVGDNVLTVTAHDAAGNTATDVLTVTYSGPPPLDNIFAIIMPTVIPSIPIAVAAAGGGVSGGSGGGSVPPLSLFFNSPEPGGDGSDPDVLLADDFERAYWYIGSTNPSVSNAGWNGNPSDAPDPAGHDYIRVGAGVGGGNCASNGGHDGSDGQAYAMADHSLASSATEVFIRYYIKFLGASGLFGSYQFGQEKGLTPNKGPAGIGGIYAGTLFYGSDATGTVANPKPVFLSQNGGSQINLVQNQGVDFSLTRDTWICIQIRIKFGAGTGGADILQIWMDDCGATGLSHPSSPTLRLSYTGQTLRPNTSDSSPSIGSIWVENWASPAAVGEAYYDKLMVKKTGPIPFAT